jgi:hypothetical protein
MTRLALTAAIVVLMTSDSHAATAYDCKDGQMPAPPEVAAQMALPLCGFAATKRWGPNGCQLCDSRNVYPNPYTDYSRPYAGADVARRAHRHRSSE